MAEMKYYDSNLTGQELDEAFRNLANLDDGIARASASAEKAQQSARDAESAKNGAAESAAQAKQAEDLVQQQSANLQNLTDNLEAVQNAAANAQAAAASAAAAQQAAQEALGFRTFFSAVTPDANGDLDPSRPMTTPTAASVTIKSKGDRIQSVQVNGFTQQAGSGDASPTNVREISTAGMRMVEYTLTGDESYTRFDSWKTGAWRVLNFLSGATPVESNTDVPVLFCNCLKTTNANNIATAGYIGVSQGVSTTLYLSFGQEYSTAELIKEKIKALFDAGTPVKVWAQAESEDTATGLYIPVETQGHEYRCQCLEPTAPLCNGDKVESCVPSGCDRRFVFDGSSDEAWELDATYGKRYQLFGKLSPAVMPNSKAYTNQYNAITYIPTWSAYNYDKPVVIVNANNIYIVWNGIDSIEDLRARLQKTPLIVYYRSTAYTEANDMPVQLETHAQSMVVLDGTEQFSFDGSVSSLFKLTNGAPNNKSYTSLCSQYAGFSGAWQDMPNNSIRLSAGTIGIKDTRYSDAEAFKAELAAQYAAGTPVTIVYDLTTPAIYAHDPVTLVAVPYTQADVAAANQLASTPSTLPAIDSPDVPMLLDETDNADSTAQVMALAANAVPVVGTYVVSSQDGTTLAVSLKAMQDGGDAATLGGLTLDDIKQLISDAVSAALNQ